MPKLKNTVFKGVTPIISEKPRRFKGIYRLHLQGPFCRLLLLVCCFDLEYGGDIFLRNFGLSPNYTCLSYRHGRFKSNQDSLSLFNKYVYCTIRD
jgi:hypothetical protein